jgi:hypothetical protein
MENKKDCECKHLKWYKLGDKRLICPICKKMYIIINGEFSEIVSEKIAKSQG